ncbi:S-layer homology domain-containing protein [Paenibacillus filicis]|uniref:S-layer homology domain-containing protein n=1 Tax=Paenibacillus filicis TaxID=669464 RepID=A0ABU9DP60_9BACL
MKRKQAIQAVVRLGLILSLMIYLVWPVQIQAAQAVTTVESVRDKFQGEQVTISGASAASDVIVKVFGPDDHVYFFRSVPVQGERYLAGFTLAADAALGRYTVLTGSGSQIAKTTFLVLSRSGQGNTDHELEDALNQLSIGFSNGDTWESVTSNLYMLSVGKHETLVTWVSSQPDVISIGEAQNHQVIGQVHHQSDERSVIVTATVSKNNRSASRPFLLIVKNQTTTKTSVTEGVRTVNVVGEKGEFTKPLSIARIVLSDRTLIDKTILDESAADQIIDKSQTTGERTARLVMEELPSDRPDELAVQIAGGSVASLSNHGMAIQVESETAILTLSNEILLRMKQQAMDLYFRIVPIRSEQGRQTVAARILVEPAIRQAAGSGKAVVVGMPQKIETNYRNFRTKLVIPFNGILPATGQAAYLNSLRVFIEHSDGDKKLASGTVVYRNNQPYGLELEIDKFSTFTFVQLNPSGNNSSDSETDGSSDNSGSSSPGDTKPDSRAEVKLEGEGKQITIKHGGSDEGIDKDSFSVTVNGKPVAIEQVIVEKGRIILVLRQPVLAGDQVAVVYAGDLTVDSEKRKRTFSMLVNNPGHHRPYITGYPDGTFGPSNRITRAEVATILSRVTSKAENRKEVTYTDVTQSHWASDNINRVTWMGIMDGYPDGSFRPEAPVTRAEMASLAARWSTGNPTSSLSARFTDVQGHWAQEAILRMRTAGVLDGYEDGRFLPEHSLTRAEAVTVVNKLLGRGPYTAGEQQWRDVDMQHWAYGEVQEASVDHEIGLGTDSAEKRIPVKEQANQALPK